MSDTVLDLGGTIMNREIKKVTAFRQHILLGGERTNIIIKSTQSTINST